MLGQRQLLAGAELEAAGPWAQAILRDEDGAELLDEERQPARAPDHGAHQRRRDVSAHDRPQQRAGVRGAERFDRQLVQPALPAQLAAQAAQRVPARQLIAAVGAEDLQRLRLQSRREDGEHVERPLVGPLQVVEEDGCGRCRRERRDHDLAQRCPVGARHACEIGQRGGQRPVRRGATLQSRALKDGEPGLLEHATREGRLADASLARQEHERAAALPGPRDCRRQLRALLHATDQSGGQ